MDELTKIITPLRVNLMIKKIATIAKTEKINVLFPVYNNGKKQMKN